MRGNLNYATVTCNSVMARLVSVLLVKGDQKVGFLIGI